MPCLRLLPGFCMNISANAIYHLSLNFLQEFHFNEIIMKVNQECLPASTMVQRVNESCFSFTSDQVSTCVEGNGCAVKNISSYLVDECNASSLHINAVITNKVILDPIL